METLGRHGRHSPVPTLGTDGTELDRSQGPAHDQLQETPYEPSARITVDDEDRAILETGRGVLTGHADHRAMLEPDVEDTGLDPSEPVVAS